MSCCNATACPASCKTLVEWGALWPFGILIAAGFVVLTLRVACAICERLTPGGEPSLPAEALIDPPASRSPSRSPSRPTSPTPSAASCPASPARSDGAQSDGARSDSPPPYSAC
jgi:hypothetical protein